MSADQPNLFDKALSPDHLYIDDAEHPRLGFITAGRNLIHLIQLPQDMRLGVGAVHLAQVVRYLSHENRLMLQLFNGQMASVRLSGNIPQTGSLSVITLTGMPREGKPFQAVLGAEMIGRSALLKPWAGIAAAVRGSAKAGSDDVSASLDLEGVLPPGVALIWRRRAGLFTSNMLYQDVLNLVERWRQTGLGFGQDASDTCMLNAQPTCLMPAPDIAGFCQLFYPDLKTEPLDKADRDDLFMQVEQATLPGFSLNDDVQMWFEPTRAAVCVDIDVSGPLDRYLDQMIITIIRQLMLRRLAGQVLIDLPRTGPKLKKRWFSQLKEALAYDPRHPDLLGESKGGLTEISIRHGYEPLSRTALHEAEGGG